MEDNKKPQVDLKEMHQFLLDGEIELTFKKVDGTVSTRKATKYMKIVEKHWKPKENAVPKKVAEGMLIFFDTEKLEHRSCRLENIISYKKIEPVAKIAKVD
jgi:hypothetical protein